MVLLPDVFGVWDVSIADPTEVSVWADVASGVSAGASVGLRGEAAQRYRATHSTNSRSKETSISERLYIICRVRGASILEGGLIG